MAEGWLLLRLPVRHHDGQRRRTHIRDDEKALAVRRDVVAVTGLHRWMNGKQRARITDPKRVGGPADVHRHDPVIERDVEEFLAVAAPPRMIAAGNGDARLAASGRKSG